MNRNSLLHSTSIYRHRANNGAVSGYDYMYKERSVPSMTHGAQVSSRIEFELHASIRTIYSPESLMVFKNVPVVGQCSVA